MTTNDRVYSRKNRCRTCGDHLNANGSCGWCDDVDDLLTDAPGRQTEWVRRVMRR